jgi:2-iminobutanoate/2-iminopropanoate deaminase
VTDPGFPLRPTVTAGSWTAVSGQVGVVDAAIVPGGVRAETRRALLNLDAQLRTIGATKAQVVKTTVYLVSMADYVPMNEEYAAYFDVDPPARTAVAVLELPAGARVEIEAWVAHAEPHQIPDPPSVKGTAMSAPQRVLAPAFDSARVDRDGPVVIDRRSQASGLKELATGFVEFPDGGSVGPVTIAYEESFHVVTGSLTLTCDGATAVAEAGGVLTLEKGTTVTYRAAKGTRAFYALVPADWNSAAGA